jgi:hypothetical protein
MIKVPAVAGPVTKRPVKKQKIEVEEEPSTV